MKFTIKGRTNTYVNAECEVEFNTRRNDAGYLIIDIDAEIYRSIVVDQPDNDEPGAALLIIKYYGTHDDWDGRVMIKPIKPYDNKLDDIDLAKSILSSIESFERIDKVIYCPSGLVSPICIRATADIHECEWGDEVTPDIDFDV